MRLLVLNMVMDRDDPGREFIVDWVRALAEHVQSVDVITMRTGRVDVPDNVRVWSVGKERGYSEPRRAVELYRHLRTVLGERHIDVCFSHMIPIFTVLAAPALKAKSVPIVSWYAHRQVSPTLKIAHRLSTTVVTSAQTSYGYRHDKVVVVGQGIDTEVFRPNGSLPEEPPLLISVGRISPIKDILTLIEACHLVRQHGHNVSCTLIGRANTGDEPYERAVHERIDALGLTHDVRCVGAVAHGEVVQWYRRCFAHVNLCPTGALDKAALEAMACGRPSLAANEGFRDTMGAWKNHLVFRHGDTADLAARIEGLIAAGDSGRRVMGEDLRRSVVERHGMPRLVARLLEVFGQVAGA